MSELIFYTNPMSRGQMVRWMLHEVGADYQTVLLDYATSMKAPEYLAINPMGKVPAIKHGDVVVTECAAIITYLADLFPEKALIPPVGDPSRGSFYRWMHFSSGPVEAAVAMGALGFEVPEGRRGMVGWRPLDEVADILADNLSKHDYMLGDSFSAADVYTGAQIMFGLRFGTMPNRDAFGPYVARISERAARKEAQSIDIALIEAAQQK